VPVGAVVEVLEDFEQLTIAVGKPAASIASSISWVNPIVFIAFCPEVSNDSLFYLDATWSDFLRLAAANTSD
jgi:hypothetical protein